VTLQEKIAAQRAAKAERAAQLEALHATAAAELTGPKILDAVATVRSADPCDRPLAAPGLTSYRCRNRFGWTMIGARDNDEAFREALRSCETSKRTDLEVWDERLGRYVKAYGTRALTY
jgi:hypothetical protein